MKKTYLFTLILGLNLLGCGGNKNDSRPVSDGKGNIDVAAYLPSKTMTKHFAQGFDNFGSDGYQNIIVAENKVYIEQHAFDSHIPKDVLQKIEITYNDTNITNFFHEGQVQLLIPKTVYRHINEGELLSNNSEKHTTNIDYDSELKNIGTSTSEITSECHYKGLTNIIKNSNKEIIEKDGEFLVIACNKQTKETYNINKEYRDVDDRNGKFDYYERKYLAYYEKDVGFIYEEDTYKETIKPCKKISSCQYNNISSYYNYHVNSIDYN